MKLTMNRSFNTTNILFNDSVSTPISEYFLPIKIKRIIVIIKLGIVV